MLRVFECFKCFSQKLIEYCVSQVGHSTCVLLPLLSLAKFLILFFILRVFQETALMCNQYIPPPSSYEFEIVYLKPFISAFCYDNNVLILNNFELRTNNQDTTIHVSVILSSKTAKHGFIFLVYFSKFDCYSSIENNYSLRLIRYQTLFWWETSR